MASEQFEEYDDPWKQNAWEAFWYGYREGYGVEDIGNLMKRAARSKFEERWGLGDFSRAGSE